MLSKMNEFDVHSNPSERDFQVSFEKTIVINFKKSSVKKNREESSCSMVYFLLY